MGRGFSPHRHKARKLPLRLEQKGGGFVLAHRIELLAQPHDLPALKRDFGTVEQRPDDAAAGDASRSKFRLDRFAQGFLLLIFELLLLHRVELRSQSVQLLLRLHEGLPLLLGPFEGLFLHPCQ